MGRSVVEVLLWGRGGGRDLWWFESGRTESELWVPPFSESRGMGHPSVGGGFEFFSYPPERFGCPIHRVVCDGWDVGGSEWMVMGCLEFRRPNQICVSPLGVEKDGAPGRHLPGPIR
jgi:hypothetical protein